MQILRQGEYAGDTLYMVQQQGVYASVSRYHEQQFNNGWHCHENAHISYVLKGGCSEKKKYLYERLPGTTSFYLSDEPHQMVRMHDSVHVNLEMGAAFFQHFDISEEVFAKTTRHTPDAQFLMLNVYRELIASDGLSVPSIQILLLNYLDRSKSWRNEESIPVWMRRIHELMHDQWAETPTLQELAQAAGVHPVTLSHYFPKYFGCTLGVYMRKLKIARSLQLLKLPGSNLTGIAYTCGFFDQSHFIRTFKQLTGLLPSAYQKL
ncbi:MAG: AraC family transcriptional regulator [Chitinophagaceae bacterium]